MEQPVSGRAMGVEGVTEVAEGEAQTALCPPLEVEVEPWSLVILPEEEVIKVNLMVAVVVVEII